MNLPQHRHSAGCDCYKPSAPPPCQHPHYPPQQTGGAGKWIGIGVGGSVLLVTVSVAAVAVAIAAVSITICVVVLYLLVKDLRKGGR